MRASGEISQNGWGDLSDLGTVINSWKKGIKRPAMNKTNLDRAKKAEPTTAAIRALSAKGHTIAEMSKLLSYSTSTIYDHIKKAGIERKDKRRNSNERG